MTDEIIWQRRIIKSVKNEGGWGRKWATQMTVGVPDLILALPHFGMFCAEVKLYQDAVEGWNRRTGVTEKQRHEINKINSAGGLGLVIGIVEYKNNNKYAIAFDANQDKVGERVFGILWSPIEKSDRIPIHTLMEGYIASLEQ